MVNSRENHMAPPNEDERVFSYGNTPSISRDFNGAEPVVIALTVAYNGAPFAGFARQPGQLTVQGSLEEALSLVFRRPIETVCAGRTDSGVHARGQVVSFVLSEGEYRQRSDYKLLRSFNALTHDAISVLSLEEKDRDFSARFSAVMREYRYFICIDRSAPLFMNQFSWHLGKPLDLEAMQQGAQFLIGEHDFRSFCLAASAQGKTTNRYVKSIAIEPLEIWGENFVVVKVEGNAFLHSMVRTIVGTLVAVGLGKRKPLWAQDVLDARDRSAAGENAPAAGLVFWHVDYEGQRVYDPRTKQVEQASGESLRDSGKENGSNSAQEFRAFFDQDTKKQTRGSFSKHSSHKDGHKTCGEFVIPRGEGASLISGAAYSPVNRQNPVDGASGNDGKNHTEGRFMRTPDIYGHTEQFGEVIWSSISDLDEPCVADVAELDMDDDVDGNQLTEPLKEPQEQSQNSYVTESAKTPEEPNNKDEERVPIATFGSYPFQIKPL